MSEETKTSYEHWSLVEIMGHQQLAGRVSETVIAGAAMLRVDVPEVEGATAFTTFLGAGSIYRLTPVSEEIARRYAQHLRKRPVEEYNLPKVATIAAAADDDPSFEEDEEDDRELYEELNRDD